MLWLLCCSKNVLAKSHVPIKHTPLTSSSIVEPITKQMVEKQLHTIEYKDCNTFYHNFTFCKCVKVYDGDTITVSTKIINNQIMPIPYKFSVRLMGIDAPEIKGGGMNEKLCAIRTRDELRNKILGKIIRLEIVQTPEKWGRILAKVFLDDEDICQWLLDTKMAVPYEGKTKIKAPEWLD
jgi:micrococcal nuclease